MRVLVTGGAGFIGSKVVRLLLQNGHEVTVVDTLEYGNAKAVPTGATLVEGDSGNPQLLDGIFSMAKFDGVIHAAAYKGIAESQLEPCRFFVNNVGKTLVLLDRMMAHGISRIVFTSSVLVYGSPNRPNIDETCPMRPINAYGYTKLQIEQSLGWLFRSQGFSSVSLRPFHVAGQSEHVKDGKLFIPLVLNVALGNAPHIKIFGTDYETKDGTCVRDYTHVDDVARAHVLALQKLHDSEPPICTALNVGNKRGYSVREVIETARKITGRDIPVIEEPRRSGDAAVLVADCKKIKRELGWEPERTELSDIIQATWDVMRYGNQLESHGATA